MEHARHPHPSRCAGAAGLIDHSSAGTDGEQELLHQRAATIIAAEFGGGVK